MKSERKKEKGRKGKIQRKRTENEDKNTSKSLVVWYYDISTFVGYSMPNLCLYKLSVLFQTIQFSISTQFDYQKHSISSYSVQSNSSNSTIHFSISTVLVHTQLNVKTVLFQRIQFS